jgi:transcriptional regulator with XRE-family HTH domain
MHSPARDRAATPEDLKFAELGSFLASRRAEVTPEQVGLPGGGIRRAPGLRREEVAMLAGVGASWYAWIEQGRARNVSAEILAAIADVLTLSGTQRQYVMRMAGYSPPDALDGLGDENPRFLMQVLDDYLPNPAYCLNRYWDMVAANSSARRLLGVGDSPSANYLELLFTRPGADRRFPAWELEAAEAVTRFRTQAGEFLGDRRLDALIQGLCERSPLFAELWDRHRIADLPCSNQVICHPELGEVPFTRVALDFVCHTGLQLILLSPQSSTAAAKIARWSGASRVLSESA